jgi:hypothetical protein
MGKKDLLNGRVNLSMILKVIYNLFWQLAMTEEIPNLTVGRMEKVSTEMSYNSSVTEEYIQL